MASISGIFSLALLHTQMLLCYWLLQLGLCDLCLVSVILTRCNIRFRLVPKNLNVFHLAHVMAIHLQRKMYLPFHWTSVVDYVASWPHLGHTISNICEDRLDVMNRCNSLCAQINNLLWYFKSTSIIIKTKLLMSYYSSYYGAKCWYLGSKSINDGCVTRRKGLRRVWGIYMETHNDLLARMWNSIPIFDELCRRNCSFINSSLISDNFLVRSIAVRGVYFDRMLSPLGRNAQFCCERFIFSISYFSQLSSK